MDLEQFAALRTPEGSAALDAAARVAGGDPLTAAAALRSAVRIHKSNFIFYFTRMNFYIFLKNRDCTTFRLN
ncbi:hypothetical protein ACWEH1_33525 [Micromonospora chersina]